MKQVFRFLLLVLSLALFACTQIFADSIPRDEQKRIIESYLYVTGHMKEKPKSMIQAEDVNEYPYIKCGTAEVMDFVMHRKELDADLLRAYNLADLGPRPSLPLTYTSPSGRFKIHYAVTGTDAVYRATTDVAPANGIPDYIDTLATIADSAHNYTITDLGYPEPPSDGFYSAGVDSAFDIYVRNLGGGVYGLTYTDSVAVDGPGSLRATSFMEIDNDYQEISVYQNRPLDAARVTIAHEYFHSVQFGIDFTEAENYTSSTNRRQYWMEMSATWMEEQQYDGVNDYYFYLPAFFNRPGRSIQQFSSGADLHPYGSMVFAQYLSERFGRGIIKDIWLRCGQLGIGPNFLTATENSLDSILGAPIADSVQSVALVFREFSMWNYFTGSRASFAPNNLGYSEKANYPLIPADSMAVIHDSTIILGTANRWNPDHLGTNYVVWDQPQCLRYDTAYTYWLCTAGSVPNCTDSMQITDTTGGYDFRHVDSVDNFLSLTIGLDPTYEAYWGVSVIYQLESQPDSFEVDFILLPGDNVYTLPVPDFHLYKSIVFAFTPASEFQAYYTAGDPIRLGLIADEKSDTILCPPPEPPDTTSIPFAELTPYPNPAVLSAMSSQTLTFAYKFAVSGTHLLQVDIFTEAGEYLTTVDSIATAVDNTFKTSWDFSNSAGKQVGSGVYILYGRLFTNETAVSVLSEDRSKVLIVR